jgi:predicted dehydrogenase
MAANRKPRETSENTEKRSRSRSQQRIRYAVVGLGYISQVAILPAFAHAAENSELVALVSGDETKLTTLSKKYKVNKKYSYEGFADCLASGEIDAVYIGLPNNMHRAYAEGAARAGVHVLCEKPMAKNEQECEAMMESASRANVKLMIAYRLHFEKGNLTAAKLVREGKIGDPRIFHSEFSQQVPADNMRLKEDSGGGPIYDLGVYCINAARYLFRAEPEEVFAYNAARNDKRFSEVAEMTSVVMRFPDERLASFTCSFRAADRSSYEVIGTKGVLRMDPAYEMTGDIKCEITIDEKTQKQTFKKRDQFGAELVYFSDCILKNKEPEPGGPEGLADVRIIDAILESASSGKAISVVPTDIRKRPTLDQEIQKPPVQKPVLVRAAAPSK